MTHSVGKKQIGLAVAYPRAAALVTTTLGCSPAPSSGAAFYTVTPDSVKVTAGIVAGEITEMKVTGRFGGVLRARSAAGKPIGRRRGAKDDQ